MSKKKQRDPKKSARSNRQLKRASDIEMEEIERGTDVFVFSISNLMYLR